MPFFFSSSLFTMPPRLRSLPNSRRFFLVVSWNLPIVTVG
jgi:hypothetical protein